LATFTWRAGRDARRSAAPAGDDQVQSSAHWTPENAVGIGGAYMCIYGMEGPGGYQFVGRTLQVYNRFRSTSRFAAGTPWLLRFFDQIRFFPISAAELLEQREAFPYGKSTFASKRAPSKLRDYEALSRRQPDVDQQLQGAAAGGVRSGAPALGRKAASSASRAKRVTAPPGRRRSGFTAGERGRGVARAGQRVEGRGQGRRPREARSNPDDRRVDEDGVAVEAPSDGVVVELLVGEGRAVAPGQRVAVLRSEAAHDRLACARATPGLSQRPQKSGQGRRGRQARDVDVVLRRMARVQRRRVSAARAGQHRRFAEA